MPIININQYQYQYYVINSCHTATGTIK